MALPSNIVTEATFLQSQVTQNQPLTSAPRAQIVAMQLNGAQLIKDTDTALKNAAT